MSKKEKKKLFTEAAFNNVEEATATYNKCQKKVKDIKLAMMIAGGATMLYILAMLIPVEGVGSVIADLGLVATIVAYALGGGFVRALKTAWTMAAVGWYIVPIFPIDFGIAFATFVFAIGMFLVLPIVFVGISSRQNKKNIRAAEEYIRQYQQNQAF